MKSPKFPTRIRILLALLAAVVAFGLQVTLYNHALERSLKVIAETKVSDLNSHFSGLPEVEQNFKFAPRVTVAREYLVFGTAHGKVHIFSRSANPEGKVLYSAFDFYFDRSGDRWIETESGYCGHGEVESEAKAVFAALHY